MSSESSDEFCITCKANLTQGQKHSESCNFLQKVEKEKKEIEEKSNKAIQKAQEEIEKTLAIEKEKITHEAREQLLQEIANEKHQIEQLKIKNNDILRSKVISKILQFDSEKQISKEELEKMNLDSLNKYYQKIIKVHVAEKNSKFLINYVKCGTKLGHTMTRDEAIKVLKLHKKSCPKHESHSARNWILFGLLMAIVSSIAISFAKSNPQLFKKGEPKND